MTLHPSKDTACLCDASLSESVLISAVYLHLHIIQFNHVFFFFFLKPELSKI